MVLTAFATASFLSFGTLLVIFGANASEIIADLELDYAAFGLLGSILSLGLGTGIVIAGPIVDRAPWRPLFVGACAMVIAATTTVGPETGYALLVFHMFAIGFGAGFYETVVNALVIEVFGSSARRRLLFIHSGAALAACVVPLLIGWIRQTSILEWTETFWLAGVVHIPVIVAALFLRLEAAETGEGSDALDADPDSSVDDRVVLAALCVAAFAYVGVEAALTIFVVDHVSVDLGFGPLRAGRTISAFWGGLFIGRVASALLPRSPGAGTTAILSGVSAALLMLFGLSLGAMPELVMLAVGLAASCAFPVLIALAGRALPSAPATAVGLAGGLGSLGGFFVPWATGALANRATLSIALASLAAWMLLLSTAASVARFRRSA